MPGDCALAHASGGGWFGRNFSAPARVRKGWTPSGHTRLLSASRLTVAPNHCMHPQQSGQKSARLLRSSSGSAGAGRQAVICFGLCASEERGFAYMLRSGSKLGSACNLTLPLSGRPGLSRCVQLRLCPTRVPRGHRKITRSNTKANERPAFAKRTSRSCNL